ncbi:hypothetical protein SAMN04488105_10566 [Salipiger thiooxidans]|uniref:Uncharacterized protein n=1 Tax=Salipiger thiooxidans TaxID=282683 RepID=A0A1G7E1N1_9RHOB|nr:hypothetical protein SAMN04488105_10566 [Salipiger thiooxidans]
MSPTPGRNDAALTKLPASAPGVNELVAGAIVLTTGGALPEQHLAPGDRGITEDSGAAALRGLRHHATRAERIATCAGRLVMPAPRPTTCCPRRRRFCCATCGSGSSSGPKGR